MAFANDVKNGPASVAFTITPADVDLTNNTRGIYIGSAGTLKVTLVGQTDSEAVTFNSLATGVIHPLAVKKVWAISSASDIIGIA